MAGPSNYSDTPLKVSCGEKNPFDKMKDCSVKANREREFFVTREQIQKVLEACPDNEWRLIVALARFRRLANAQ